MIDAREEADGSWVLDRDGERLGTARIETNRRGTLVLDRLDVPQPDASAALDALMDTLRDRGEDRLAVDVVGDDPVMAAAVDGRDLRLVAIQMELDLARPVATPARVELRPMSDAVFAGYRDHLVTGYAQDMVDAGSFPDPTDALAASEQSTQELLPQGSATPGEHLWTAYDGDVEVGILWIHVDAPAAYIYDIEVHADQRRRGYGREVLDAGAIAARSFGAERLGLNVFGHNPGARAMYEQAGYRTTELSYRADL